MLTHPTLNGRQCILLFIYFILLFILLFDIALDTDQLGVVQKIQNLTMKILILHWEILVCAFRFLKRGCPLVRKILSKVGWEFMEGGRVSTHSQQLGNEQKKFIKHCQQPSEARQKQEDNIEKLILAGEIRMMKKASVGKKKCGIFL